jgi:hypothetical protein
MKRNEKKINKVKVLSFCDMINSRQSFGEHKPRGNSLLLIGANSSC